MRVVDSWSWMQRSRREGQPRGLAAATVFDVGPALLCMLVTTASGRRLCAVSDLAVTG
jgi:hypothetical protein